MSRSRGSTRITATEEAEAIIQAICTIAGKKEYPDGKEGISRIARARWAERRTPLTMLDGRPNITPTLRQPQRGHLANFALSTPLLLTRPLST